MGYPPRRLDPSLIYFVTSRTIDGTLFLRPSAEFNDAVGAVLAKGQERYGAEIFDFVLVSNHFHLAVRCPDGRLPEFMQYVKANIATAVNHLRQRTGHVWERRYVAEPILDEAAQVDRAVYIYGHGVKEGLVPKAADWPGIASVKERLTGQRPSYQHFDLQAFSRARYNRKEAPNPVEFYAQVTVRLSPWPFMAGLDEQGQRRRTAGLVELAEGNARRDRGDAPVLGVAKVLAQDPFSRPIRKLKRTPSPRCHAHDPVLRQRYREVYSDFVDDYRGASERFRAGHVATRFPRFSYPPPLPQAWRRRALARLAAQLPPPTASAAH